MTEAVGATELRNRIASADFSKCAVMVVGHGNMGRQFVLALQRLGVPKIRVCTLGEEGTADLHKKGVGVFTGGYEQWTGEALPGEVAILALPIQKLVEGAKYFEQRGFRRMLIEKPVSLWASEIECLDAFLTSRNVDAVCGFNRVAYPAFAELRARAAEEGGISSCHYAFTEMVNRIKTQNFRSVELERWGIANSIHVMSMAHGLIGIPGKWRGTRSGNAVPWHTAGSVFIGSGITDQAVPFTYQADWGSTGRWWVELNTPVSGYRLCPLEELYRRTSPMGDWEQIPIDTFAPEVKTGFVEQVAALLDDGVREAVPSVSIRRAFELTRFTEQVMGYL
jgi:hypothetical protein